ncbi:MAG TPA: glycosyltransferase family 39 protein [Gaiellaceae bacterium]|nr:glycosyltransferase family 39 protein [Gaiellaceae bacterium]
MRQLTDLTDGRTGDLLARGRALAIGLGPFWGVFAIGACSGLASLLMYRSNGYSRSMLLLWLIGLLGLSVFFWSRNRLLPRISTGDVLAPLGLVVAFAPLYLLGLYRWPVQVSGDEVAIIDSAKGYAHPPPGVDPFGVSIYASRPALLFLGWAKLGEWFGGFDLYHMRLLHAVCGLLTIVASYVLMRQLLPRGWAIFATCIFGVSHSFFMISRLAMRENTAVLVEVVALTLLLWGLRRNHALATFLGGVVAGLGFYVYFPARATLALWLAFLVALGVFSRRTFPVRKLLLAGSIAIAGFVLMATPIMIAESKIPHVAGPSEAEPQRQTLMIYEEARIKQRDWMHASSVAEGFEKNIRWGLGTFNNKVADEGFIYFNVGHGFVDPLTGILLWLGVGVLGIQLVRRRADEGVLLAVSGFLILWLSFAFLINKAPNYTRLLITLPFVAYLVTEAVRWLVGRWRSVRHVPALLTAVALVALVSWNLAIAWDFIQTGRRDGETLGSTGRYVSSHRDTPGKKFYLVTSERGSWDYYSYGTVPNQVDRITLFADDKQIGTPVVPEQLAGFEAPPPFALIMRRDLWQNDAQELADRYPTGRIKNVTPDGSRVALEVPPA